jgi:hypothetical protein
MAAGRTGNRIIKCKLLHKGRNRCTSSAYTEWLRTVHFKFGIYTR